MGFPFHSTGCVKCAKESWNEKPHHQRLGSPQRGVNRRLTAHRPDEPNVGHILRIPLSDEHLPGDAEET
jgi:hypothetical protein